MSNSHTSSNAPDASASHCAPVVSSDGQHFAPVIPPDDVITGESAADVFRHPRSTFAERRRRLELELDRVAGVLRELPVFDSRDEEEAWRAAACLIVVEWGGFKAPHGPWTFLRSWCEAYHEEGLIAVLRAHQRVRATLGLANRAVVRRRGRRRANGEAARAATPATKPLS